MSTTSIDTTKLVDAPFSKMSAFMSLNANFLGLPLEFKQEDPALEDLYRRAAEVLNLSGPEPEYTAARIRHLDFVARTSSLADQMNWRSMLKDTWNESRIYDKRVGFFSTSSSSKVALSPINLNTLPDLKLNWSFDITGESITPSLARFTVTGDSQFITETVLAAGGYTTITLASSGYMLGIQNNLSSGETMTGQVIVRQPYIGDIIPVKNSIIQNPDLLLQLTVNNPDLYKYMTEDNTPEDVVAAFLLAIDSL